MSRSPFSALRGSILPFYGLTLTGTQFRLGDNVWRPVQDPETGKLTDIERVGSYSLNYFAERYPGAPKVEVFYKSDSFFKGYMLIGANDTVHLWIGNDVQLDEDTAEQMIFTQDFNYRL